MELARELRRGLEQGATDDELQRGLEQLEQTERDHQEGQRRMLKEIDSRLSARQRVELRFFTQQFRREIQEKVRELRGGREQRRRPPRPGRRRQ